MKINIDWGKFLIQLVMTAIISAFILAIVGYILGYIPSDNILSGFVTAVVSVVFFVWAMEMNPGNEEFLTSLPQVILSIAIVDLIRNWMIQMPELVIPLTFSGLALGLGSVFLANMIVKKYVIK